MATVEQGGGESTGVPVCNFYLTDLVYTLTAYSPYRRLCDCVFYFDSCRRQCANGTGSGSACIEASKQGDIFWQNRHMLRVKGRCVARSCNLCINIWVYTTNLFVSNCGSCPPLRILGIRIPSATPRQLQYRVD